MKQQYKKLLLYGQNCSFPLTDNILFYIILKGGELMEIFHGMMKIRSDKKSDKYICVNNFGYFKNTERIIKTLREKGRSDYQIIYIEKGTGTFTFNNQKHHFDKQLLKLSRGMKRGQRDLK